MSPRTPKRHTVQHFTHVHPLTEFNGAGQFICDGCKTYGSGKTYRCDGCNYDLHDYCATCPHTLWTFLHPQHEITLVVRKPKSTRQNERVCDICGESVEGLFYRCKLCEFDAHPLCTQLPQHVRHVIHPAHPLEFSQWGESKCMVCYGSCQSWRYRCGACRFDVHMECVLMVCDKAAAVAAASPTKQRGLGHRPGQAPPSPSHFVAHGVPVGYGPIGPYPYYNHFHYSGYGYDYWNMNPGLGPGPAPVPGRDQGPAPGRDQGPAPGKGRRMFNVATKLAIGAISNLVFGVSADFLTNLF